MASERSVAFRERVRFALEMAACNSTRPRRVADECMHWLDHKAKRPDGGYGWAGEGGLCWSTFVDDQQRLHDAIRRLKADDPTMNAEEIGKRVHRSRAQVSKLLTDLGLTNLEVSEQSE